MNIERLKYIDEFFGPLICFVLHIYNSIAKIFAKPRLLPVNKILLIKFFGMGSIIMMGPMVKALRESYPEAEITILTFKCNVGICNITGLFDNVVAVDDSSTIATIMDMAKKIFILRRERFDIAIDLEFFSKSSTVFSYLTGSRNRVGFFLIQIGILLKMMWRGNLMTHQVFYNHHKHTTEAFLALAAAVCPIKDIKTSDADYASIRIPNNALCGVDKRLKDFLKKGEILIFININSGSLCQERRWPKENFSALIRSLSLLNGALKFALTGDKNDAEYVSSFIGSLPDDVDKNKIIDLSGKLSLAEFAAVIKSSDLVITNDSGPLHIAVSLGRPTVSFFGPETAVRYGPRGELHTIFSTDAYCSPCLNTYNQKTAPCNGKNICMDSIKPDVVFEFIVNKYNLSGK
jgi:ADP-heptose:LPS heptosyltransferase